MCRAWSKKVGGSSCWAQESRPCPLPALKELALPFTGELAGVAWAQESWLCPLLASSFGEDKLVLYQLYWVSTNNGIVAGVLASVGSGKLALPFTCGGGGGVLVEAQTAQLSYHPGLHPQLFVSPPQHLPHQWPSGVQEVTGPAEP